jgi:hypothetical protein
MWSGLMRLKRYVMGFYDCSNEPLGSINCWEFRYKNEQGNGKNTYFKWYILNKITENGSDI